MIFGSLSSEVPELIDYIGDLRPFLDMHLEQSPNGMEIIPGRAVYTFRGNWKIQLENVQDPYHVTTTHAVLGVLQSRRAQGQGNVESTRLDWQNRGKLEGGAFE